MAKALGKQPDDNQIEQRSRRKKKVMNVPKQKKKNLIALGPDFNRRAGSVRRAGYN